MRAPGVALVVALALAGAPASVAANDPAGAAVDGARKLWPVVATSAPDDGAAVEASSVGSGGRDGGPVGATGGPSLPAWARSGAEPSGGAHGPGASPDGADRGARRLAATTVFLLLGFAGGLVARDRLGALGRSETTRPTRLRLVASRAIAPRRVVHLLEVDEDRLVLGVGPDGFTVVARLRGAARGQLHDEPVTERDPAPAVDRSGSAPATALAIMPAPPFEAALAHSAGRAPQADRDAGAGGGSRLEPPVDTLGAVPIGGPGAERRAGAAGAGTGGTPVPPLEASAAEGDRAASELLIERTRRLRARVRARGA